MNLVISIDKPKDITSQDAVTRVKRTLNVKKAGHCGTLDPMATGLMLICVNRATRVAAYLTGYDKEYEAVMKLGEETDTQDAYGDIIAKVNDLDVSEADIKTALSSFEGEISQIPPMHSALKHKGKPLYKYARKGVEIERRPRKVNIKSIDRIKVDLPFVSFRVSCSKGTYIRTFCHDIGKKLGVGAHMTELRRTAIGDFLIEQSLSFDELESIDMSIYKGKGIYSLDSALSWMPELIIGDSMVKPVTHGNPIKGGQGVNISDNMKDASGIRIKTPSGELLAIGIYDEGRDIIKMNIVFSG